MTEVDPGSRARGPSATRRTLITGAAASAAAAGGAILAGRGSPVLAATGSGSTDWVNVVQDYQADPTGGKDSTSAFQNAISSLPSGGGVVYVPAGTYAINSGPLAPRSGMRLTGDGCLSTTLTSTATSIVNAGSSTRTDLVEIDHLALAATNADVITGANITRWYVHDCQLIQHSAGNSIWGAPNASYMVECRFERNREDVHGTGRTIHPWHVVSATSSPVINQNAWRDCVLFLIDGDSAQRYFFISNSGAGGHRNNAWQNLAFEHANGGMFRIESGTGTVIDHCWSWDTQTIALALIYITQNAASAAAAPAQTVISNSGRLGPALAPGVPDIQLDSSCVQTLIQACGAEAGGGPLTVDLGNSANVCLIALPASATILNQSPTTHKLYG